jgi:hypothetical protein
MSEKHKPQQRWHPLGFLTGWTAILIVGWILSVLGFWEILWLLPGELRYLIRRNIPFEVREMLKSIMLVAIGIAIPTMQYYWLNRSFNLRLSWWWIVLTVLGNTIGMLVSFRVAYFVQDMPYVISLSIQLILFIGISALLQWWMLRKRWHHAWLWIVVAVISIYVVNEMARLFFSIDIDWIHLDYRDALELMPAGAAHGLLTGITALALDWFTRKQPVAKNKIAAV